MIFHFFFLSYCQVFSFHHRQPILLFFFLFFVLFVMLHDSIDFFEEEKSTKNNNVWIQTINTIDKNEFTHYIFNITIWYLVDILKSAKELTYETVLLRIHFIAYRVECLVFAGITCAFLHISFFILHLTPYAFHIL